MTPQPWWFVPVLLLGGVGGLLLGWAIYEVGKRSRPAGYLLLCLWLIVVWGLSR